MTRGRERGGVPFSVLISRILNIVPHSLGKGTVSGGDPVTVSLVPWPPPLDDGGSGQMKGINALIAAIKFQINGSLFFPGTPIQRPIGELWVLLLYPGTQRVRRTPSPLSPSPSDGSITFSSSLVIQFSFFCCGSLGLVVLVPWIPVPPVQCLLLLLPSVWLCVITSPKWR